MRRLYNDKNLKERRISLRKSQTDAERKLWQILRNKQINGLKFFRQYSIGNYILDFYCPAIRLAIEVDGSQHIDSEYDEKRTSYLRLENVFVLRLWNNDVLNNLEGVYLKIASIIEKLKS
jgi:very-short-patch-repair endonuclease